MRGVRTTFYRRCLYIVIVIFLLSMIKSTLAFWTQELWLNNEYQLGKYSTEIEETFKSPTNWLPGEDVNKKVHIVNNGTVPVFVKVQINLGWFGQDEITQEKYELTFIAEPMKTKEYAALISWGQEVVLLSSGVTSMESLRLGLPVINDIKEATGKWLLLDEEPDKEGNLTFYYVGALKAHQGTPLLIDHVQMNPRIAAKIIGTNTTYDKEKQEWETQYKLNPSYSYENAKFLLTVNAKTVQATRDALGEVFTGDTLTEQTIVEHLKTTTMNLNESERENIQGKALYFEEINGNMQFTPIKSDGQNRFMSISNMIPGEQYADALSIENRSKEDYELYMQVVPRANQSQMMEELLELIQMKVYLEDKIIYDGTASGIEYQNANNNLQRAVLLGKYASGKQNQIRVELKLSENASMEYCELLTKIDWKFMANKVESPDQPKKSTPKQTKTPTPEQPKTPTPAQVAKTNQISSPKTGDDSVFANYMISMTIAIIGITICIWLLKKQRKAGGKG